MDTLRHEPLHLDLSHHWDDESDVRIKNSIISFLSNGSTTAQDVANQIAQELVPGENNPAGTVDYIEDMLIFTSKFLPFDHSTQEGLLQIVKAIREIPQQSGRPSWEALFTGNPPGTLVEAYEGALELTVSLDDPDDETGRQQWRSFNAFEARLTRDKYCDCSSHAGYVFREALEEIKTHAARRSVYVLIACDWLRLVGDELVHTKSTSTGPGGPLWKGKHGFSPQRWEFWKRRLHEVSGDPSYNAEARQAASNTYGRLEALNVP